MKFVKDQIGALVLEGIKKSFPEVAKEVTIKMEYPTDENHGDYATAVSFELSKKLRKNPREVAQTIIDAIELPKWVKKAEVAGGAFINFFLSEEFVTEFASEIIKERTTYGHSEMEKGKTVVTDTSHPNVAKPMGVHHLLSTIIGNSINRILAAVGYKVIRDNYLGDWGTQFGKLIYAYKTWGDEKIVKKDPIPELLKLYVKFHDEVESKPELEDLGRAEFKKLEQGDKENRKLWKWIVDLSMEEFERIWKRLDVSFDVIHGESFYEDKMQEIIDMGIKKGLFVEGERGALIFPFAHEKYPPCIIRKSDGTTIYATRDLARTKYWEDTWHPDLMIIVADTAQELHFKQFFEVAAALGITKAPNIHAWFGRMSFPEKKMSTRKGNIVLMEDVLDEAEVLAYEVVQEKNPDLSEAKKKEVARQVGIGAVKYSVLSQNRTTNVTFTWDKMLSLEGNSGPYLQYVYARARSILNKAGVGSKTKKGCELKEPSELSLARMLIRFPEVVYKSAEEFKPNTLTTYLFEVASKFNSFYGSVPVLQGDEEMRHARLKLVEAVTVVLKNGLSLLGIETPEEM